MYGEKRVRKAERVQTNGTLRNECVWDANHSNVGIIIITLKMRFQPSTLNKNKSTPRQNITLRVITKHKPVTSYHQSSPQPQWNTDTDTKHKQPASTHTNNAQNKQTEKDKLLSFIFWWIFYGFKLLLSLTLILIHAIPRSLRFCTVLCCCCCAQANSLFFVAIALTLLSFYNSASGCQFLCFCLLTNAWHSISFRQCWCFCLQGHWMTTQEMRKTIYFIEKNPSTFWDEKHASAKQLLFALDTYSPFYRHWSHTTFEFPSSPTETQHNYFDRLRQFFHRSHLRNNVLYRILAVD